MLLSTTRSSFQMASPVKSEKMQQGSSRSALYREPLKLTLNDVYELGKSIAQDIQRASSSTKGSDDLLKGIVERVLRALEWLETYVEEAEELRSTNYRLMLKADELTREKSRRNALEQELKVYPFTKKNRVIYANFDYHVSAGYATSGRGEGEAT